MKQPVSKLITLGPYLAVNPNQICKLTGSEDGTMIHFSNANVPAYVDLPIKTVFELINNTDEEKQKCRVPKADIKKINKYLKEVQELVDSIVDSNKKVPQSIIDTAANLQLGLAKVCIYLPKKEEYEENDADT